MVFQIEVLKFLDMDEVKEKKKLNSKLIHIGYLTELFSTRKQAAEFYKKHNPHMRDMRAETEWYSDWDPVTRYMFVVRNNWLPIHANLTVEDVFSKQ